MLSTKKNRFFGELVEFITSGPVLAFVLAGENAIVSVRALNGATNPVDAAPGSIRGDYALTMDANVVHASDSPRLLLVKLAFGSQNTNNL